MGKVTVASSFSQGLSTVGFIADNYCDDVKDLNEIVVFAKPKGALAKLKDVVVDGRGPFSSQLRLPDVL